MEFVPLLMVGAFIKKVVDLVKDLRSGDVDNVATQLVTCLAGVIAIFIFAATGWGADVTLGGKTLSELSTLSKVWLGLNAAAFGSVFGYDIPKRLSSARDAVAQTENKLLDGKTLSHLAERAAHGARS